MLYIFDSELPENKSIKFSLRYIFGVGKFQSNVICNKLGLCLNLKTKNLKSTHKKLLNKIIKNLNTLVAGDLKKNIALNNSRLVFIKSYRGLRKEHGLPVRGQRTHSNAKTSRKKISTFKI